MRIKPNEIIKFFVYATVGFTFRVLYEFHNTSYDCSLCPQCSKTFDAVDVMQSDMNQQLREPFKPVSIEDVIPYQYFTGKYAYDINPSSPRTQLHGHEKRDVRDIAQQAMSLLSSAKSSQISIKSIINGYRKFDPLRGEEYILDVETSSSPTNDKSEKYRLELVKPFSTAQLIKFSVINTKEVINIILPIANNTNRVRTFIKMYESAVLQKREEVSLYVILFNGPTKNQRMHVDSSRHLFMSLKVQYPMSRIEVIETHKPFSRALGTFLGTQRLPGKSLLHICDIDVIITPEFLQRCRQNPTRGKSVYYPIIFKLYEPDMVKKYSPPESAFELNEINKHTGYWVDDSHGSVCLYKSDYTLVGGMDQNIKAWGLEDTNMFEKHIRNQDLSVFRSVDPGLIHSYYNKSCAYDGLSAEQKILCVETKLESFASKTQLARKVLFDMT